jgi:hypothetical protein
MRLRPRPFVPPFTLVRSPVQSPVIAPVQGAVLSQGVGFEMSFVTSAVVTSGATIAIPATARLHDLAVLFDGARNGASVIPTKVIPTNWTEVADVSGSGATVSRGRLNISYKVLEASEPGSNITGMDDTAELKIMLIFRPTRPIVSVTPSTATGQVTDVNPTQQSISMAAAATPVIGLAHYFAANAIDPRTATPEMNEVTNGTVSFAKYIVYNSAPADHVIDMDDEGTMNCLQGVYLMIA